MLIDSVVQFLLFFLFQQGEVLIKFGLNLLHPFICVFGGGVQLLLQQTQTDIRLTQLLALKERAMLIIQVLQVSFFCFVAELPSLGGGKCLFYWGCHLDLE